MLVHAGLVLFAVAILARAVQLQIVEHDTWLRVADRQHVDQQTVKPLRGAITDATGTVLVESREQVKLSIAPREIRDVRRKNAKRGDPLVKTRAALRRGLQALSVPEPQIRKALDTNQTWVSLPTLYMPSDIERFAGLPGVHVERVRRRINSASDNLRGVLGAVDADDLPVGGIELELDLLLRGQAGSRALVKDPKAGNVESPELSSVDALPGHTVSLTVNQALQEIAENELKMALVRTGGTGGDVVILDPAKLTRDREQVISALKKYNDMNKLAMSVVKPGGILLTCSCTGLVSEEDFLDMIRRAAFFAGRRAQILKVSGAGADHPYMAHVKESRYLKAVFCRIF